MAKISNLALETLKFAENSITTVIEDSYSGTATRNIAVANPGQYPAHVFIIISGIYTAGIAGTQQQHNYEVLKVSSGDVLYKGYYFQAGTTTNNPDPYSQTFAAMDYAPAASDTYRITHSIVGQAGSSITGVETQTKVIFRKA